MQRHAQFGVRGTDLALAVDHVDGRAQFGTGQHLRAGTRIQRFLAELGTPGEADRCTNPGAWSAGAGHPARPARWTD
ncbi:hypothetical protein G6F35_019110 [Rhizopus arrhizus]|nr:hypothetical protein G6F35_019110 [Rhizopus arrhizus]